MADKSTTTTTGTTVTITDREIDAEIVQAVLLDHPDSPADLRNVEAGIILDGGFMPRPFLPIAYGPEVLSIIADHLNTLTTTTTTEEG